VAALGAPGRLGVDVTDVESERIGLRSAIREALHLTNVKGLGVVCEACGSKVGRRCYGNGPMARLHQGRNQQASDRVKQILMDALEPPEGES
jgi:hypothetical protein